jgi:hypothetical protein
MNTQDVIPDPNARLLRIARVSRVVRWCALAMLAVTAAMWLLGSSWTVNPGRTLRALPAQVVLWLWYWQLARLFQRYEKGCFFAAETISCIKKLGALCVLCWALHYLMQLFRPAVSALHSVSTPGQVEQVLFSFKMGLFSFSIAGINLGLLMAGSIIFVIAWVMDEGRKLQEEQALTI